MQRAGRLGIGSSIWTAAREIHVSDVSYGLPGAIFSSFFYFSHSQELRSAVGVIQYARAVGSKCDNYS